MERGPKPSASSPSPSSPLSSIASFSRKHLVPPTPNSVSPSRQRSTAPAHSYSGRTPVAMHTPFQESSPRFSGLKRTLNMHHTAPRNRQQSYLTTPEEDMGHTSPSSRFAPPPTIQQIASGLATHSPTYDRPPSTSSSISSFTSSAVSPIPLRSSLKKTSTNLSITSSSVISVRSTHSKTFAVRHLLPGRHAHSKMSAILSEGSLDDAGSLRSNDSSVTRRVGRVRFSDDEEEGHHSAGVKRPSSSAPTTSETPLSSSGKLANTRRNVMKMFHRSP